MPRRQIQFASGAYYHIYNRGANKTNLFCDEENYLYFLRLMKSEQHDLQVTVIAYCLMPNHYHWVVRQDGEHPAGVFPQRVCKAYSNAFNNRYGHRGSLFEGSYKALAIGNDEYLHQLCRYIHANPVRHGFTTDPALWPYSNYHEWVGTRCGTLVDRQLVQEHFPVAGAYQAYVMSYVRNEVVLPAPLGQYLDASDGA